MRTRTLLATAATALLLVPATASAQEGGGDATVTVVHGIPDTTADIWVDGDLTLDDFEPGVITDRLALPAGEHTIALTAPDAADASEALQTVDITLKPGANASVVVHLDEAGNVQITAFTNDVSPVAAGDARVVVRHVAATGPVDVAANGDDLVSDLAPGQEATAEVPAGNYAVSVTAVSGGAGLADIDDAELPEGAGTIMYAVGNPDGDTFEILVQTVAGLQDDPEGVPAGTGGLVDNNRTLPAAMLALVGMAALALAFRPRSTTGRR